MYLTKADLPLNYRMPDASHEDYRSDKHKHLHILFGHQCYLTEVKGMTQSNPKMYKLRLILKKVGYAEVNLRKKWQIFNQLRKVKQQKEL